MTYEVSINKTVAVGVVVSTLRMLKNYTLIFKSLTSLGCIFLLTCVGSIGNTMSLKTKVLFEINIILSF